MAETCAVTESAAAHGGPRAEHHVVVIGAGIGGLVSALLLACRGLRVTLVEAAAAPGGKMRQVMVDGAAIDAGPTVFTMRWVFDQILAEAGVQLESLLRLTPLSVLARHAWRGHDQQLDLFADRQRSADTIAAFSSPAEARRFLAFCAQARRVYDALEGPYIRSQRPSLLSMGMDLGPRGLAVLAGLGPFATLWKSLARHFHDPRLQQLFGRYATYCGASPWAAPATLMLVAQVELDGVWAVDGGMHAVAVALAGLAQRKGVQIEYGQRCEQIVTRGSMPGGAVSGVRLADGRLLAADSVVFNGDANALASGLLGAGVQGAAPPMVAAERSLSAVTWALRARSSGFPLLRHNVFFDADYRSEFDDIFGQHRLPRQGTVYVCAQDRGDRAEAGDAATFGVPERLLCLVNAPADGDQTGPRGALRPSSDPQETDPCEHRSLALLRQCGLNLQWAPQQMLRTTPQDFHRLFPATGGALYGRATHGWMSSFSRPTAASAVPGLYLAGGSVHPGPGVPMAAMSGRLAAATLLAHLDSTSRSRRVRISGGISTPSATTVHTV
jgi:1-hydroxycarotenoid 3,4-desaturase